MNFRIKTTDDVENYINSIPKFASSNTPDDTKGFLKFLGNPDKDMRIIHVAGTNGKGSVCAFLNSILRTAGYTVGLFTSPHLVDIRERFLINDKMPEEVEFVNAFNFIIQKVNEYSNIKTYHPTYFEFMFFVCMKLFSDRKPDFCILETGLGGRLDATNSVSKKELCVITRIGLDHTEYLGNTEAEIAGEKAGIMQEGVPTVYLSNNADVNKVYSDYYDKINSPVTDNWENNLESEKEKPEYDDNKPSFQNDNINLEKKLRELIPVCSDEINSFQYELSSIALYQKENATIALSAIRTLLSNDSTLNISEEDIKTGLKKCVWQGRMEEVYENVFVDGAHNEDGIKAFLNTVENDNYRGSRTLLFSVVKDKDYSSMINRILEANLFVKIAVTTLKTNRTASISALKELLERGSDYDLDKNSATCQTIGADNCNSNDRKNKTIQFDYFDDTETALQTVIEEKKKDERIYIAGSLYLVGEIKKILKNC